MTSFEELADAVLEIADRKGMSSEQLAAELRVLADVALFAAGFDAPAVKRMGAALHADHERLEKLARKIFRRRGRTIPPEVVS